MNGRSEVDALASHDSERNTEERIGLPLKQVGRVVLNAEGDVVASAHDDWRQLAYIVKACNEYPAMRRVRFCAETYMGVVENPHASTAQLRIAKHDLREALDALAESNTGDN